MRIISSMMKREKEKNDMGDRGMGVESKKRKKMHKVRIKTSRSIFKNDEKRS